MTSIPCPICAAPAVLRDPSHPGYLESERHAIYSCSGCLTAFTEPRADRPEVYDRIYALADEIPGYHRYHQYARLVERADDPLAALSASEDVYWAIEQSLGDSMRDDRRILEIGSGLGYMTCALARRGHSVTGIDISAAAVAAARARFGDHFERADLAEYAERHAATYDVVIACELIEHLIDPVPFVQRALSLLRPGGRLVLTTPNRSLYDGSVLWETELPPVHFWWFSEAGIASLAARCGATVRFIDFTAYQRVQPLYLPPLPSDAPTRSSNLTAALAPTEGARAARQRGRLGTAIPWIRTNRLVQRLRGKRRVAGPRRTVMCAILEPFAGGADGRR